MNRYILMGAVFVAAVGYGYIQDHPELLNAAGGSTSLVLESVENGRDDIIALAPNNPEMEAAYAQTQKYLDEFLALFGEAGANGDDFTVKVAFPVIIDDTESDEIIWTSDLEDLGDGNFTAKLGNDPEWMEGYQIEDRVEFTADMIRDWSLNAGDKYYGHFTTRVLRDYVSAEEKEMMDAFLMEPAVPPSFNN